MEIGLAQSSPAEQGGGEVGRSVRPPRSPSEAWNSSNSRCSSSSWSAVHKTIWVPFLCRQVSVPGCLGSSPVPEHVPYLRKSLTLPASPIRTRWWMTCLRVREAGFRCSRMVSTTSCPVWRRDGAVWRTRRAEATPSVSRDLKASHLPHPCGRGIDPEAGPLPQGSTQQLCGWKT